MSSGGRIQLAAVGEQDIFLTANPETTYFVKRYKRHSQFAIQTLEVPFEQEAKFGGRVRAEIPRNGDLMREIYLKITLPEIDQSLITQDNPITGETEVVKTCLPPNHNPWPSRRWWGVRISGQVWDRHPMWCTGRIMDLTQWVHSRARF